MVKIVSFNLNVVLWFYVLSIYLLVHVFTYLLI